MGKGIVRYWAAAKAAAGVAEESVDADTLAAAIVEVVARDPSRERLAEIVRVSSYIVNTRPVGTRPHESVPLDEGWVVEVLPPFAGG
jgi:molybdopterin converting factor small subunit